MHTLTRGMAAILSTLAIMAAAHAAQVSVHDPVMAKEGDTYYLYSTGPGITFYSSKNMLDWQPEGRVFAGQPTWAKNSRAVALTTISGRPTCNFTTANITCTTRCPASARTRPASA